MTSQAAVEREIVIEPGRGLRHYWSDLWAYRELFVFLAWRDILVRYKQTVIGVAWAVLRPFLTMVVFSLVFGGLAGLPAAGGAPYPILVFAALLPWQFFSGSLADVSASLIGSAGIITKVYFPRLIIPMGALAVNVIDFGISLFIMAGLMAWFRYVPSWNILLLPLFFLLAVVVSLGSGLWLAALSVKYRDVRFIVPFLIQAGLFITPVGFDSSVVPERYRLLYSLNPLVGIVDGFRWCIIGSSYSPYLPSLVSAVGVSTAILILGVWYFRRVERGFVDII